MLIILVLELGTFGGVVQTHRGPVIAIMHQYALLDKGASIHFLNRWNGIKMTLVIINAFMLLGD
jgi:hypothetical protein